ncbi:DNA repair protein complementing XP-G cells [Thrips palmi]|uniref:DNA repair protein complementing XP-G cells n=1 Tax=Thrips palmi TaxID=161013 RepID=A0A6P8Z625_THRPL|nr:DNA repair protein complementing XP-G cells [Thrips palmi]
MGVHGLWKLLEAAGKPVPLETLENKVLAVDVSIWLHQMMKGYQDSRGAPLPNAHLLGLFHRVCKLLFYRIKPVFVFDGGVPLLKKQTIAARKKLKSQATNNAAEAKERLLKILVKRKAIRHILGDPSAPTEATADDGSKDDMFHLPPLPSEEMGSSDDETNNKLQSFMESSMSDDDSESETKPTSQQIHGIKFDLHSLDVNSEEFLSLPPDVRHDILSDLKETRKQNSWGRLHEMPEESGDFSNYQLGRLLKRRNVQVSLEQAEKEMGGKVMRMSELQELMAAQGVDIIEDNPMLDNASHRIASDSTTRFVLCKEPGPAPQSSLSAENSISADIVSADIANAKTEDNPLYNEQVEFIAQMAENMIQKLTKNKEKPKLDPEVAAKDIVGKMLTSDESAPGPSQSKGTADIKILADSWSSDDESVASDKLGKGSSIIKTELPEEDVNEIKDSASPSSTMDEAMESDSNDSDDRESKFEVIDFEAETKEMTNPSVASAKDVQILNGNKETLEIVIRPDESPDDDDIFADVFQSNLEKKDQNPVISMAATKPEEKKKKIEIIIDPTHKPDENDLFADVFQTPVSSVKVTELDAVDNTKPPSRDIEIISVNKDKRVPEQDLIVDAHINKTVKVKEEQMDDPMEQDFDRNESSDVESSESNVADDSPAVNSSTAPSSSFLKPPTSLELNEMEASLQVEQTELQKERGRQERLAASITDQMCVEAQELLQLFGVPYLVAPMEAEAQCAFLDSISLTEGSITDDSDIWLFGGKKVYKNFFNQNKHVLQFTSSNINHYFKLSREQLIQLALLVGSDYTTGIQGIGPVTALEIVAAFQSKMESDPVQNAIKGLSRFRDWLNSGRPHKTHSLGLLDKKLKNVKFAEGFPSQAVVEAYMRPSVEDSQETFSWGTLDLPALREYARSKFGWPVSKTDEILLPVSKRWNDRASQRKIDSYFNFQPHLVEGLSKMSKRVQKAVTQMEADDSDSVDDPDPKPSTAPKKKNPRQKRQEETQGNKPKRVRSQVKKVPSNNEFESEMDSVSESLKQKTVTKSKAKESEELPVRAPTVPRERSSTGVKRVGVKSVKATERNPLIDQSKPSAPNKPSTSIKSSTEKPTRKNVRRAPVKRKNAASDSIEEETLVENDSEPTSSLPQPSTSRAQSQLSEASTSEQQPCSSQHSDGFEGLNVSSDLAALSEMNWEDDPWHNHVSEEETRPKLFFGGIRPNKPRKPARSSRQVVPAQSTDTRGVRPGWVTQERMESRAAWVDSSLRKKEESIPQRERDQRALEEAKMKAIALVKATEAKQASRLLGRTSKRGRAKARPARKVLPEHNLSESSSDE